MGSRPPVGTRLPFVPALEPGYYNRFAGPNNRPPPAGLSGLQEPHSAVISKPKVVYSAPPVRNVPKREGIGPGGEQGKRGSAIGTVEKPPSVERPVGSDPHAPSGAVGPGATAGTPSSSLAPIPAMPDYSLQDLMEMPMDAELMPGHPVSRREKKEKKRKIVRTAAGQCWEDQTLAEWENGKYSSPSPTSVTTMKNWVLCFFGCRYSKFLISIVWVDFNSCICDKCSGQDVINILKVFIHVSHIISLS